MACNVAVDGFVKETADLDISEKYIRLMQDSLHEDSLYTRSKDTLKVLFDDLQLTEKEKAGLSVDYVTKITVDLSKYAMSTALTWSKEERDGEYALAKLKADTRLTNANYEVAKENICKIQKEAELTCANISKVTSDIIRENGTPTMYDSDGCTILSLEDKGLKWHQTRQAEADAYSRYADAYRKSGVVEIAVDPQDGTKKGLTGNTEIGPAGYTFQQQINAERLRISYEDSKLNHAANSSATMIGTMLSAEIAPNADDVQLWRDAVKGLLKPHSSTDTP